MRCGHTVGDLTNRMFRFVAFSCLFSSGLGAVLPEMLCCLANNTGRKDEKKVPGEGVRRKGILE